MGLARKILSNMVNFKKYLGKFMYERRYVMKYCKFTVIVGMMVGLAISSVEAVPFKYAMVVKSSTLADPAWAEVIDTLQAKHGGEVFSYSNSIWETQADLSTYMPSHICFLAKVEDITSVGSEQYARDVHQLTRALDADLYGDAVWGILTGYNADDAMRIATTSSLPIGNILLKDAMGLLNWVYQGMYFACHEYGLCAIKYPGVDTFEIHHDGPTDCTDTLVTLINTNTFDLVMPGGHGNHNAWQLHWPSAGLEGFFKSSDGQVYGAPYSGSNINVNSTNPKVFFAPYNCYHGFIQNSGSFVPSWTHTGGVIGYWGNTISVATVYMKGHGYIWAEQGLHTLAEAFYITNQALLFCMENNVPGTNYSEMLRERDVWAWYGEPSCDIRINPIKDPRFSREFIIDGDTVTYRVTATRDSVQLGVRAEQVLIDFLPFKADSIEILYHNAYNAVVTDNFALLHIWNQGDPPFDSAATREVVFIAKAMVVKEQVVSSPKFTLLQSYPNPFSYKTQIKYQVPSDGDVNIAIYNSLGERVAVVFSGYKKAGFYSINWIPWSDSGKRLPAGVYFCELKTDKYYQTRKMLLVK
jgi:hypothetical protein